jgi:DinB family protein
MPIEPDTKDWTWVLDRPCPECGFEASTVELGQIPDLIRANAAQWPLILAAADARDRPSADRWSPLEYGCHVRDVFWLYDTRLHLMLDEDDPTFANWDQDETAVSERYGEQDPGTVGDELVAAAERLAASFAAVTPEQAGRTGTRSDGARFTVESFARYLIHDPVHHLWDVR